MKMVERMARAMCARVYGDNHYDHYWEQYKAEYIDNALAALRAMREPTHDMLVALSLPPRIGRSVSYPDGWVSKEAFAAMIDAVIKEAEKT